MGTMMKKKRKLRPRVRERSRAAVQEMQGALDDLTGDERKKKRGSVRMSRAFKRGDSVTRASQARKAANASLYQNGNEWKTGGIKR